MGQNTVCSFFSDSRGIFAVNRSLKLVTQLPIVMLLILRLSLMKQPLLVCWLMIVKCPRNDFSMLTAELYNVYPKTYAKFML